MSCLLTVIVAQVDPAVSLRRAIDALERACADLPAEIVVAQTAECPRPEALTGRLPLQTIRLGGRALTPQLWAEGLVVAKGKYVAFTLANCEVSAAWAGEVIAALHGGAEGVAGPIECAADVGWVDRALYYLRYSAFIAPRVADADVAGEIPGDHAVYRRASLERHRDVLAEGFWEVLFHRRLRREGGRLCTRRAARARFWGGVGVRAAVRHRFAHGRHFGAWRVAERVRQPWQIGLAAPVVPLLLGARAAVRVLGHAEHRGPFLTSVPVLLAVAGAWAAGEVVGAFFGAGLPAVQVTRSDASGSGPRSVRRAVS